MIISYELVQKFEQAEKNDWGYIWGTAGILWTEEKQRELVRKMEAKYGSGWKTDSKAKQDYYYQGALNGGKWIGHLVADCSGLFSWAFKALGASIAHGSNSIWKDYCSEKGQLANGKRTDGKQLLPGTAVFTASAGDQHDHIGLYIGDGKVVEAQGTNSGVITTEITNGKWKCWGELKGVSYQEQEESQEGDQKKPDQQDPDPGPEPATRPTIRKGNRNRYVRQMQTILEELGYDLGICGIDGDFGTTTENAVKAFQKDSGLTADGICGPKTWTALEKAQEKHETAVDRYTVTIPGLTAQQAKEFCREWTGATMKKE